MIDDLGDLVVRPFRSPIQQPKAGRKEPKHMRFNREQVENLPCQHCPRQAGCVDTECFLYLAYKRGERVPVSLIKLTKG